MTPPVLLCRACGEPIDPVAYPTHPVHDITDEEWATMRAGEQRRAARATASARRPKRRSTR